MNAVDKYEYKEKTEQMLELMEHGSYRKAAEVADEIDWKRVRNASMLTSVSDIYEKARDYQKSYEILNLAHRRAEGSRKIISRLCTLAVKTGNVDEAIDYYDDFIQAAPKDPNQYILRYQILRAQRAPIEQQIEALEEYKKSEYIEEWAYELAKLYQEAGMTAECLEECDDLILWFSEGQYVYKAMELKMQYKPLTPSQQEKYDKRYEKLSVETEEMPDIVSYAEAKTSGGASGENAEELLNQTEDVEKLTADHAEIGGASEETGAIRAESAVSENAVTGAVPQKKKIGDTMPLDEALRKLLQPENEKVSEDGEPELADLEQAIGEIESVADMDIVERIADEKISATGGMKEITPEQVLVEETQEIDTDQISGQMRLEDILSGWEGETEKDLQPETPIEDLLAADAEEAEDDLLTVPVEEAEDDLLTVPVEEAEEDLPVAGAEDAEDIEEDLFEEGAEDVAEDAPETAGDMSDDDMTDGEEKGETAVDKSTTAPILSPEIQRMIDEIEGVIPAEEEKPAQTVQEPVKKASEPTENMGEVTESLRIDDDEDFAEDLFDDEYSLEEEETAEELSEEEYFADEEELEAEELEEEFGEEPEEEEYFAEEEAEAEELEEEFGEEPEEEEYLAEEEAETEELEEEFDEEPEEEEYFAEEEAEAEEFEEEFDEELEDEELEEDFDEGEYFDGDEEFEEDFDDGEDFDEDGDFDDELTDIDEEFSVNPEHAELGDDREIPDDDDDNMDILSATTPLSRKETAKMIATGKTAPLPLDEISDALSMDTGFIVHGRYDLETQSGIGTRAGLTEEQKKLFSYFVPVRGMSEQLVDVLEQDKNCTNRNGTSRAGNLLIIGNKGNGKTVLAVDVVKAIQKQRNIKQGKVAIVTGDSLNKKKISDIFDKLHGGALIIEKAGRMNEKTVARLNKAMEGDTGELLIVLEEQRKPLDRLLTSNREFRRKFTSRLEIPIFINDELVTFGQTYAQENGYRIDEMGILALYSKIDSLQREDHAVTVAEVKEIMDEAIGHSQKASAKKLMKRVFGKNTDEADRIILSENDFNI